MDAQHKINSLLDQLNTVIVGKKAQVQDCVACLLAGGHLLIEDVPGVGKTTLAHALSRTFGLQFSRVQFTADLMPSDLTGVSVYERGKEAFVFHPGPVFAQVLLAGSDRRDMLDGLLPLLSLDDLAALQHQVLAVHTAEPLLNYVQDLIAATRSGRWFLQGLYA